MFCSHSFAHKANKKYVTATSDSIHARHKICSKVSATAPCSYNYTCNPFRCEQQWAHVHQNTQVNIAKAKVVDEKLDVLYKLADSRSMDGQKLFKELESLPAIRSTIQHLTQEASTFIIYWFYNLCAISKTLFVKCLNLSKRI